MKSSGVVCLLPLACAAQPEAPGAFGFGSVPAAERAGPAPAARAAALRDDLECRKAVAADLARGAAEPAFQLMTACAHAEKFRDLDMVTSPPLREYLDQWDEERAYALVAAILAQRGADLEKDVPFVQSRRVPIYDLNAALAKPALFGGRFVLFRGVIEERRANTGGVSFEIAETARQTIDRIEETKNSWGHTVAVEKVGSKDRYDVTGRVVVGHAATPIGRLAKGREYVFFARFESFDEDRPKVALVRAFEPGLILPEF